MATRSAGRGKASGGASHGWTNIVVLKENMNPDSSYSPMHRRSVFPWALPLLVLLAGCVGDAGAVKSDGPPTVAEKTDATGGIEGNVVTDEIEPIASAQVALSGGNASTKTAADGGFAFSRVEPGMYTLVAARIGYFESLQKVTVVAGEIAKTQIILNRIPVAEPSFNETWKFRDVLPVSAACLERGTEQTRGYTWDEYVFTINATKPDGVELAAVYTEVLMRKGTSDASLDVDMYLYDPEGKEIGESTSGDADEEITIEKILKPGSYKIQACNWSGAQADYLLTITITYEQGEAAAFAKKPKK